MTICTDGVGIVLDEFNVSAGSLRHVVLTEEPGKQFQCDLPNNQLTPKSIDDEGSRRIDDCFG